jgi:hypothetical protein
MSWAAALQVHEAEVLGLDEGAIVNKMMRRRLRTPNPTARAKSRAAAAAVAPHRWPWSRALALRALALLIVVFAIAGLTVRVTPSDLLIVFGYIAGLACGVAAVRAIHPNISDALEYHARSGSRLRGGSRAAQGSTAGA